MKPVPKRIVELAHMSDCTIDRMGYGEGNLEMFARLIIGECLWITAPHPNSGDPEDRALERAFNEIKDRFGITEPEDEGP
jgi:hypothetical protein